MGEIFTYLFITELELLGFQDIKKEDIPFIKDFLNSCIIVDLNQSIKRITINLKQSYKIKLPDAIIAATSVYMNLPLISADKDFGQIDDLKFIRYEV